MAEVSNKIEWLEKKYDAQFSRQLPSCPSGCDVLATHLGFFRRAACLAAFEDVLLARPCRLNHLIGSSRPFDIFFTEKNGRVINNAGLLE